MTEPETSEAESVKAWSERMDDIMQTAVEKAIEENRSLGIYAEDPESSDKVAEDSKEE